MDNGSAAIRGSRFRCDVPVRVGYLPGLESLFLWAVHIPSTLYRITVIPLLSFLGAAARASISQLPATSATASSNTTAAAPLQQQCCHGAWYAILQILVVSLTDACFQLTKADEESVGDEVEVRREDQDKINKFSRLHQRELIIEEELRNKSKEKEELDDLSTELELTDEDETVPYKIGDAYFHVLQPQAIEMLEQASTKIEEDVEGLESKLETIKEEMTQLKVELYARFGKSINLET
ncbi:Prefoldin subunit 4 [Colletotrichum tanaceti]|uniref:Prefoldin subunit 4 n=1 Tax=Colletotrichum tanaceti TaxID=1306861 RepID=A0A4U6XQB7_9PEZI|nr:Prefoldin subunit 4 [Colletotrichum tanaceti]TKW58033.1 Prefoldin subunit 4 [Colletotrichum tanaceti]